MNWSLLKSMTLTIFWFNQAVSPRLLSILKLLLRNLRAFSTTIRAKTPLIDWWPGPKTMLSRQEEIIVTNWKKSYNWVSTDSKIWMKLLEKSSRSWLTKTLILLLMMMMGLLNKRLVLPSVRKRQQVKQKVI